MLLLAPQHGGSDLGRSGRPALPQRPWLAAKMACALPA